jgi:hypothetical protein
VGTFRELSKERGSAGKHTGGRGDEAVDEICGGVGDADTGPDICGIVGTGEKAGEGASEGEGQNQGAKGGIKPGKDERAGKGDSGMRTGDAQVGIIGEGGKEGFEDVQARVIGDAGAEATDEAFEEFGECSSNQRRKDEGQARAEPAAESMARVAQEEEGSDGEDEPGGEVTDLAKDLIDVAFDEARHVIDFDDSPEIRIEWCEDGKAGERDEGKEDDVAMAGRET